MERDLERRRPACPAISFEVLVALASGVVGRQVGDVRRTGVERERRGGQQQQREDRQHRRHSGLAGQPLREPHPGVLAVPGPQLPAVHVGAEQREPGRDREERGGHGQDARHDHAEGGGLEQRPRRDRKRAQHPHGQRCAREHDRPPGARDRLDDRLLDAAALRELLAEARHDQQGIVDPEREADHREHVEGQRVEGEMVVEDPHHRRPHTGHQQSAGERHEGRDRAAEHEQQQQDQDRERDLLSLVQGVQGRVVQGPHERCPARELRLDRGLHVVQHSLDVVQRVLGDLLLGSAHLQREQGLVGRLAQGPVAADRVRAQHLHALDPLEPVITRSASAFSCRWSPAGPFSSTARLIWEPNWRSVRSAARWEFVPGIWRFVSWRLSLALPAKKRATTKMPTQTSRIGTGLRMANRAIELNASSVPHPAFPLYRPKLAPTPGLGATCKPGRRAMRARCPPAGPAPPALPFTARQRGGQRLIW